MTRVTAVHVVGRAESGRTKPIILSCEDGTSGAVEVYCKLSASCDAGVLALVREAVAAHLAVGLSLSVPEAYLVEIPPDLADAVDDQCDATRIRTSSGIAYGSARLPSRFTAWSSEWQCSVGALPAVLLAFAFDAVAENPDRRPENPNCLVARDEIRLIDHKLSFPSGIVARKSPWEASGLQHLKDGPEHIFRRELIRRSRLLDFEVLRAQWTDLDEGYVARCRSAIPEEWEEGMAVAEQAIRQVRHAKKNIDGLIDELRRILK